MGPAEISFGVHCVCLLLLWRVSIFVCVSGALEFTIQFLRCCLSWFKYLDSFSSVFLFECFACMHICVPHASEGRRGLQISLELELQIVMRHPVGAGIEPQSSARTSALNLVPFVQFPHLLFIYDVLFCCMSPQFLL